jgi:virginiamycin B lyase
MRLRRATLPPLLALAPVVLASHPAPIDPPSTPPRSSAWLARLPDGEVKRQFILDCTGCHQFNERIALPRGRPRTEPEWREAVTRMLGYASATSSFPVIALGREPGPTAAWLTRHLGTAAVKDVVLPTAAKATITEFALPDSADLPHDLAVEASGSVLVTGMFTHQLYRLDPATKVFAEIPIPVEHANPRAIELDPAGRPWLVLGAPGKLATVGPDSQWRSFDVGMYAHSLGIAPDGKVWFNGHFTRDPELLGAVDPATGKVTTHSVPPHPTMATRPGGPIPYELRVAADGRVWMSELQGNRMVVYDPRSGKFQTFTLPTPKSGPRRFDLDRDGTVWIPAYSANRLVRLDPATGKFEEIALPIRDAVPYVVRTDPRDGSLWIGTSAADVLLRYRPDRRRFDAYPLPSHGALVRHIAVDPKSGAVWLAYGASPGIAARIARVQPE